jgi:uncharacterized repeat protein (TIGR01451 family)
VDAPDPVTLGLPLTYTFTVSNLGPHPASGVTLTQVLDAGASFVSASPGCGHVAGTVTCAVGTLANGTNASVTVTVTPTAIGNLPASGTLTASEFDPVPANNTASAATQVAPPALSIGDVTLTEGNAGVTAAVFTVSLSAPTNQTVTVNYATADVTATAGLDYVPASGQLTFDPLETTQTLTVFVVGDTTYEPSETFQLSLSGASMASIGDGVGLGSIGNDDAPAGPSRVFVSVLGLDTNDCSNIVTPCRTLNAAIGQVAEDGEVIVTRSGSYAGATITKGVKIDAASGVVAFSGLPVVVNAGAGSKVVIRGMTVKAVTPGTGTGIQHQSGDLFLEGTVVDGWQVGLGTTSTGKVYVMDSTLRNNSGAGMSVSSAFAEASLESTSLLGNGTGLDVSSGKATVSASVLSGNGNGLVAGGGSEVSVEKSQLGLNAGVGVLVPASSLSTVRLNRCVVSGNGVGLQNDGGTIAVAGTNAIQGNGTNTTGTMTYAGLQ